MPNDLNSSIMRRIEHLPQSVSKTLKLQKIVGPTVWTKCIQASIIIIITIMIAILAHTLSYNETNETKVEYNSISLE